jgi:PKD repeat protein
MRRILLILLSLWSLGQLSAQFSFSNRTSLLSDPTVRSGAAMAVADMNGDGLDDIIRLHLTTTLKIDYQTTPNSNFVGFTYGTLAGTQWSICIADVDRNGYNDIFTGGYHNGLKFLRANSSGSNYSLTTLSIPSIFLQGSNFVDINNDGHVDVFACNDDGISVAFRNNGSGGFMADTSLIYPQSTVPSNNSGNYGSVWIDYNNDRSLDLYISKCRFGVNDPLDGRRLNLLFQNDGNNKFTDVAEAAGLRPLAQSWATDFADIDNDGDLDAFIIVHDGPCLLYLNNGFGGFTEITAQSGISDALAAAGPGIQARFADFDNDGWVDLLFTSQGSAHCLFRNNGNNTFTNFPNAFPTDGLRIHSAATGDLNNDGFLDVIAGFGNGYNSTSANPDRLFMNNGNGNNFFKVHLQGMASNPNGIGARLEIYGLWGIQIREVRSGESYGIMNSLTQHFGLADYPYIDSLVVRWPSGVIDKVVFPPINQTYTLQEGSFCQAFVDFNATINGQEVTFSDESGIGADQWLWTFGDGASSTLPNPTHTYSTNGLFEVCLQASGLCGDGQICQTVNVNCQAPQAVFGSQADGLTVAFQDQSLFSPNQWFWTFGDATASTEQNPVHVFENPGTYFICLIVTGPCGSSQVCDFITVGCNDVEASFTSEINELNVQFTDNSTGGVSQWNWNFGDGQTSAQQDPLHIFAAPGQYLVCLQVTGPCGTETTCENITVSCPPPAAAFSYQSDGLLYAFINEASGNISQFSWTFGDGNSSTDVNPFYSFSQPGVYEVCQEVAGLCGNAQSCQTITVSCAAPQAAFNYNADELQVSFQDISSNQPSVWNWTFGDGNSSTQQSPQHTYTAPGTYQVCLEAGSVCGTTQSCQTITLGCAGPVAAFNFQANQLQLAFTDNSANQPTQWSWTFGDGGSSTAQNPQHTYALPGTYQVCLTATSVCGASQECEFIQVTCNAPQAAFSFVANGLQLNFQDNSAGAPTQWSWTFGDGGASTLQNPQHAFSLPGVYEVCLTATSPCGTTQSCQTISVSCLAPQAAFNFQTSGLTVSFTDNSGNLPTGWMWTFGDGASSTIQNPQHAYAAPGAFTVCLQASSVCGSTQICLTVNVNCAAPLADFDYTADQLAVSFRRCFH